MSNSRDYNIPNEHLLLISILNSMYNDNIRQINNLTESIHLLNETNTRIRNLLIQMLYTQQTSTITNRRNILRHSRTNNSRENLPSQNTFSNLSRVFLNNTPYIIDSIQRYNIPLSEYERSDATNNNISQLLQSFFQPIDIFPTQTQVEAATRTVRYGDIVSPINRSCPISLENFEDSDIVTIIRFCGHIFNREELNTWFRSNCRCPVCRYDVRNYREDRGSIDNTINESNTNNEDVIPDNNLQQTSSSESRPSLFFDIIVDNFTEANFRNLLDTSGNFFSTDSTSESALLSLLNQTLNNSRR